MKLACGCFSPSQTIGRGHPPASRCFSVPRKIGGPSELRTGEGAARGRPTSNVPEEKDGFPSFSKDGRGRPQTSPGNTRRGAGKRSGRSLLETWPLEPGRVLCLPVTATPSTTRCFPTSCQRTAFPPSFLLGLISGSGSGVRTCWGKENGGHFGKPLCGWVGNGEKMNSCKLISIETVSLSCWLPAGRGRAFCQQTGSTIKCPLLARLPEEPVRKDGPNPSPPAQRDCQIRCVLEAADICAGISLAQERHQLAPCKGEARAVGRRLQGQNSVLRCPCGFIPEAARAGLPGSPEDGEQKKLEQLA